MTDGSILAGLTGTLVNIKITVDAVKPRQTLTGVHANQVVAGGSVAAGVRLTLVYLIFTVDSWWRRGKLLEKALGKKYESNDDDASCNIW